MSATKCVNLMVILIWVLGSMPIFAQAPTPTPNPAPQKNEEKSAQESPTKGIAKPKPIVKPKPKKRRWTRNEAEGSAALKQIETTVQRSFYRDDNGRRYEVDPD